jgi:hypothetical protein
MKNAILLIYIFIFSGCATLDKAMRPVDSAMNSTESTYQSASHSVNETMDGMGDSAAKLESLFYESSFVKVFVSDETIANNREQNYVTWKGASKHDANQIFLKKLEDTNLNNTDALTTPQKMEILKEYFFEQQKQMHADAFAAEHKKPELDEFLTDRENIQKIHEYKIALAESEHKWRIELNDTQKKVAEHMLSTLYSAPKLKFVSYDPYDEELYLSVESTNKGFAEKIKLSAEKELARDMKANMSKIKPYVFFQFSDDVLEFVGINVKYDDVSHVCDVVDSTYARQSDVVFTSEDINLKTLDVQYYDVVKNIKPPVWFNNIESEPNQTIGFGEGINKDDAKKEAYNDIAMSIKTTVSTNIESERTVSGSTYSSRIKSSTKQKTEDVAIEGSKVLKIEKKDGLWFVAILHNNQQI